MTTPILRRVGHALVPIEFAQVYVARLGGSIEEGLPMELEDGFHWLAISLERLAAFPPGHTVKHAEILSEEEMLIQQARFDFHFIHASDPEVANAPDPKAVVNSPAFADLLAVAGGQVVGGMTLLDTNVDGNFESVYNLYVVHSHRRTGIARRMLQEARSRFDIAHLVPPYSAEFQAWIASVAPELAAPQTRNSPCRCGSGKKSKNCHGLAPPPNLNGNFRQGEDMFEAALAKKRAEMAAKA